MIKIELQNGRVDYHLEKGGMQVVSYNQKTMELSITYKNHDVYKYKVTPVNTEYSPLETLEKFSTSSFKEVKDENN